MRRRWTYARLAIAIPRLREIFVTALWHPLQRILSAARPRFAANSTFQCFAALLLAASSLFLSVAPSGATDSGRISGTIRDVSSAVIASALVTVTNTETGATRSTTTDPTGSYAFSSLPVGRYDLSVESSGFRPYRRTGIVLDVNASLLIDAKLELGEQSQEIDVEESALHVETSDTQLGEVITGTKMTAVPLNGRSYTDLLALQPGVAPVTSLTSDTQQDVGVSALAPSGELNPGTISINGQREFANAFIVNGSDTEEDVNSGTAIIPNLDSIAEFRILTGGADAEFGEYSGGQINVVTKSGTNEFHGNAFEFLRNTDLDARNFFSPTRGIFQQNQFGGTFGGPVIRKKLFFFVDYQGTRMKQGVDTGLIAVPSAQDRSGNLSDATSRLTGVVNGQYWANLLSQKLGYAVTPGESYYTTGCASSSQCVFPNATIPTSAWSAPAKNLLQYIPAPNAGPDTFATSAQNEILGDDKGASRVDYESRWGLVSLYYFIDQYSLDNPYPVAQSGASVPGFNALNTGRAQLFSIGDTKPLGSSLVNEFHASFMRANNDLGQPEGGKGISLASQGFVTGAGTAGIVPLNPKGEGVENIVFNAFSIGTNANELKQVNNTYQALDNFSKIVRNHTLRFGGEFHFDEINTDAIAQFNGNFLFTGSETGSDFADFLLGIPSQYNQSQLNPFYGRNKYLGIFAQDSWRIRPNLTLNYGLRWDRIEPWYEKYNGISTFAPGQQSVVFPGAPEGILFPGDPGVSRTLAPAGDRDFSPRIGVAWSPNARSDGILGAILGGPRKTSIRAGFGTYYTAIEALTIGVLAGNPPFGVTYSSPAPPLFATPFLSASNGQFSGQPFPVALATQNASNRNPDSNIDWSEFLPVTGVPGYATTNRIPYAEEYTLVLERQFGANTVVSAGYIGTQAHRLLVLQEANPGDPALCLSLSQPSQVAPGSAICGPFGENNVFTSASGQIINGTRGPLGANYGSNTYQTTIGNSNYNALQLSLRHNSKSLDVFAAYTYSKSFDNASNLGEEVNPINPSLSRGLSAFDLTNNFVVSYDYQLPVTKLLPTNRWTKGWSLSGITRFSSGFPVTLFSLGDNSLLGAEPNGINNFGIDLPDYTPGPLNLSNNPRKNNQQYFNTSLFSINALGTPGTASRRFFHGPGMDNYDMALAKTLPLTESKALLFRVETFNTFNHTQFFGPASVDGNIGDLGTTFGHVVSSLSGRVMQLTAKFSF
jgi:carboxypeptidase family protein/TonB-dependent receptor-like protein